MTTKLFLGFWCNEGFEHLEDISKYEHWEQEQLVRLLKDETISPNPLGKLVGCLRLRAQFNTQRHYELYSFNVDSSLTEQDVRELAKSNPQYLVNWIRDNGQKIYSDRKTTKDVIV
ncbi:MAG: hypothetical protein RLZZ196_692 [Bacteroidota bacterium]|jgi:hypothetical protein